MKKIIGTILTGSIVCMFAVAPALAANNDPGIDQNPNGNGDTAEFFPGSKQGIRLNVRRQWDTTYTRITQGVQSGQLTPKEAGKLDAQQARIQQREDRMAAKNGGNLTAKDKAKLTKQQNRASKNIYKKKHNDKTANVGK